MEENIDNNKEDSSKILDTNINESTPPESETLNPLDINSNSVDRSINNDNSKQKNNIESKNILKNETNQTNKADVQEKKEILSPQDINSSSVDRTINSDNSKLKNNIESKNILKNETNQTNKADVQEKKEILSPRDINSSSVDRTINNDNSKPKINVESKNVVKNETNQTNKADVKPKKEIPIEKKPFEEFVNSHLIPTIVDEFEQRGLSVEEINLKNTTRPIAGDKCWVIYCEIKDICSFWLSFEKQDISSLKSISLSKPSQKPSILESFLIDEKRITLKLIISRILQRLNGQKLIGVN